MINPNFLKEKDNIGITALSAGCSDSINDINKAVENLSKEFNLILTDNVYGNYIVSSSKEERIKELNYLLDQNIKALIVCRGGNFLLDIIDSIDYEKIVNKKILVEGYSDPTSLLYILTTKYDLRTVYGLNAKSYADNGLYINNNINILKGNLTIQSSYDLDSISINGDFSEKGIIIGGCIEVLKDIIGTKYDNTLNFIEKYKDYNIIWYFDIYNMDSMELYNTLLQFKLAGWFKYSNTYLFSKILIPNEKDGFKYHDAFNILEGNIVYNLNLGHVKPVFTIINGSIVDIKYNNKKINIKTSIN